jgi:hypothetical protein
MKILVCGDRNWSNVFSIRRELQKFSGEIIVIHGAARGADSIAGDVAKSLGFKVEVYPAKWNELGRAAGPIRNVQMLEEGRPDLVLAFHPDLKESKGTAHMVSIARKKGVKVICFNS